MFLGIDLGTSAVKVTLVDAEDRLLAEGEASLDVQRPHPGWSEQDPESWWTAVGVAVSKVAEKAPRELGALEGIGLSGQMHGATLLDASDRAVRPAILWNDGRSAAQCDALQRVVGDSRSITGNLAMPGFTAPKLMWVRDEEPEAFARTERVLLPKDYVRLRMTGDHATDRSDASGTLWLDVGLREWSERMLDACGLALAAMPTLYEGTEITGTLRPEVGRVWGCPSVPVVAGAGDQAAGAVGAGVIAPGQASLSLGTSGVYFVADDRFRPNPERAVHAFCHCLPGAWHQMSVLLSAASCLTWVTRVTGAANVEALLAEVEETDRASDGLLFLPYLSGERTPHNDPTARGVFFGLDHDTGRAELGRAVLEGVAFAFADAQDALLDAGAPIESVSVIGGGARSALWGRILASVLDRPLVYRKGGELGPALGAARLARIGIARQAPTEVCHELPRDFIIRPDPKLHGHYAERLPRFRQLYRDLRASFRDSPQ
jgi:xylulokinase